MAELPPLPEPSYAVNNVEKRYFTAADLRAFALGYGEEVAKMEREACLTICAELHEHYSGYKDTALLNGDVELSIAASGEPRACEAIAAAIRARSSQVEQAKTP
jgi:hypothetical protein